VPDYERLLCLPEFPAGHPQRAEWEQQRKASIAEAAHLWATLLHRRRRTWGDLLRHQLAWWSGVFDIRAFALLRLQFTSEAYAKWLIEYGEGILRRVRATVRQHGWPISGQLEAELFNVLQQRQAEWNANAAAALAATKPQESVAAQTPAASGSPTAHETPASGEAQNPPQPAEPQIEPARPADDRAPVSIQEAARKLGVSDDTVRRRTKSGEIKVIELGRIRRIPQSEIDRLLTTNKYRYRN
jgi:excisionase family DNA binding protein